MKLALALVLASSATANAGPWTRDRGHFFVSTSYLRIAANSLFAPDFSIVPIQGYEQHLLGFYGEVGLVSRWLTVSVDGTPYRRSALVEQGYTEGVGDWRVGLWSGLVDRPVRLSFGFLLGIPIGDSLPSAGPRADAGAQHIAASLPTGDGEWDLLYVLSFGYSFGGVRRWPLQHYLVLEAGYWLRTAGFADGFVYKAELGVRFPWKVVERFLLIGRISGLESFASEAEASKCATGLGNGVTYTSPGIELYGRIHQGLGASIGADSALRARCVPASAQIKVALSYQW